MEVFYNGTPEGLFALILEAFESGIIPDRVRRREAPQREPDGTGSLFSEVECNPGSLPDPEQERKGREAIARLRSCSEEAYRDCLQAWFSEEPIETDIMRYALRVMGTSGRGCIDRNYTERIRTDRLFTPCQTVLRASQRYLRELDRLLGLLRFKPTKEGYLVAQCESQTFVLPGLASPLRRRFGTTAWAVQDEKRHMVLSCDGIEAPEIAAYDRNNPPFSSPEGLIPDEYEALWQEYHRIIAIEPRKNPELQKKLMPLRYWKYLPELQNRR